MTKQGFEVAGGTDPGCVRRNNEDNFAIDEELGLMVVADGMGGHNSGEVASSLATSTIVEMARRMLGGEKIMIPEASAGDSGLSPRARLLKYLVRSANTMIYEKGRAFPRDAGMGTTVVAALAEPDSLIVAHVGDSRLYLLRQGQLNALTEDHSLVGDQVRKGLITSEQASKSDFQNILTRALGVEKEVEIDVSEHPLLPGDVLLLASDGLTKMVDDAELGRTISRGDVRGAVETLIGKARTAGGVDNITVVVARVPESRGLGGFQGLVSRLFRR
ncbi:MAG: Stp1/IreP family PP2C-type Ser/Thr phosphatase [Elusimicrobia bacterium]|nr:Stp1/IreP family PP2C-type Ser/Thr phosphatase [Elusimicrobiota bacterium]